MSINTNGIRLGKHGYVICRACRKEIQEVSKEVTKEYAYHPRCRPELFGKIINKEET